MVAEQVERARADIGDLLAARAHVGDESLFHVDGRSGTVPGIDPHLALRAGLDLLDPNAEWIAAAGADEPQDRGMLDAVPGAGLRVAIAAAARQDQEENAGWEPREPGRASHAPTLCPARAPCIGAIPRRAAPKCGARPVSKRARNS